MSTGRLRVQLTPAFVLHRRPFRDTSLIVEVFARDHGRITTFARGARGQRGVRRSGTGRFASLQPFQRLLLSWHGRGEAPQLIGAEAESAALAFPAAQWLSGCYLNELVLKLTAQHDPQPALFALYEHTLLELAAGEATEPVLRRFEKQLLEQLGFGLELECEAGSGEPVSATGRYRFHPGRGVSRDAGAHDDDQHDDPHDTQRPTFSGRMLLAMAAGEMLRDETLLREARALMRVAIDHCLEGRELRTRAVARSIARLERSQPTGGASLS